MAVLFGARPYHRRWWKCLFLTTGLALLVLWSYMGQKDLGDGMVRESDQGPWVAQVQSRQLQSMAANCSPAAIEQFPQDVFTQEQRKNGLVVLHILLAGYMFLALAIVCDDYFVPSLESICDILNLQTDVAGATFMAAGSSAPELATAIIAVFIAKDDVGLGTVVGSAVYNVTFVIGLCAIFAGKVLQLEWWPLVRDCTFYGISVVALVVVLMDELVCWYEALVLMLLYFVYIVLMCFNQRIETWIHTKFTSCSSRMLEDEEVSVYEKIPKDNHGAINMSPMGSPTNSTEGLDDMLEMACSQNNNLKVVDSGEDSSEDSDDHNPHTTLLDVGSEKDISEYVSPLSFPSTPFKRFLWIVSLPLTLLLFLTIPDCRRENWKRWFAVTFTMSLIWLSVFSYVIVWMITIIGHTMGIPDTVMGMTFIAFGVSVPDAISSLIVVREGFGDMGVSNAVGSNIFDILICLGVPWLLETAIHNPGSTVQVYSDGLFYSAITLLSTVVILLLATHINGWKMNKPYGVFLMVLYFVFMTLASLYELNVFGYFQPPECPSAY